ncbi:MAG: hypothetical protein V4666_09030 [Bacteroidota bacterium]
MKNLFIYDKRNFFFLYTKKKLHKEFNVIKLNKIELMKEKNFGANDFGLFLANEKEDFIAFLSFHNCFNDRILICTEKEKISKIYNRLLKSKCFDISKPRCLFFDDLVITIKRKIKL